MKQKKKEKLFVNIPPEEKKQARIMFEIKMTAKNFLFLKLQHKQEGKKQKKKFCF